VDPSHDRFVIGSEDSASTNGTAAQDKLLERGRGDRGHGLVDARAEAGATMRQISAYAMAADLVGTDRDGTGSRARLVRRPGGVTGGAAHEADRVGQLHVDGQLQT
jgi:hypothetical protein